MSKITFMCLQRIIFRNTPTYDTSVSTEDTSPVHLNAIIIRYGNETQQRKKACCSAVYKTKATKHQPHTFEYLLAQKTP